MTLVDDRTDLSWVSFLDEGATCQVYGAGVALFPPQTVPVDEIMVWEFEVDRTVTMDEAKVTVHGKVGWIEPTKGTLTAYPGETFEVVARLGWFQ